MKQLFILLFAFCSLTALGQYPISSINITMPLQPTPNTADWLTGAVPFMINAQAQLVQGQVPPRVAESRILVTIKNGGQLVCGAYTQQTALLSNFNKATMVWSGGAALGLLGQECTLKPGTYQLCVQFFSAYAPIQELSNEVCKTFTIADTKPASVIAPQNLMPPDGKILTTQEAGQPIMLRWTKVQITPPPRDNNIMYKVIISEIKPGQTKTQAIQNNAPLDVIEVKNLTQTPYRLAKSYNGIVWGVEAFSTDRVQGGEPKSYGKSEPTTITFKKSDEDAIKNSNDTTDSAPPINIQPADGYNFTQKEVKQLIQLRWTHIVPPPPNNDLMYTIRVYVVEKGQSPAEAPKHNTPVYEKDESRMQTTWQIPARYAESKEKITFVWNVSARNKQGKAYGTSQTTSFTVSNSGCSHSATITSIECLGNVNGLQQYKICVLYTNTAQLGCSDCTILLNTPGNYGAGITVVSNNPNTIINTILPTVPVSLTAGQQTTICFNATVTAGNNLNFLIHGTCNDASATLPEIDRNHENSRFDTLPPICVCTYCDQFKDWTIAQQDITAATTAPFAISVSNTITTSPAVSIISFKAELVSFIHNGKEECIGCNKDPQTFGNFTAGTFATWGNGVFPLDGASTTHHTLSWFAANGSAILLSDLQINLSFSAPPFSPLKCCDDEIQFCIRYSFTDKNCKTCSFLKCYDTIKRKH